MNLVERSDRPMSRWTEGIRPYAPEDASQVVRLYERSFLDGQPVEPAKRAFLERFFGRAVFDNPWHQDDLPSFVQQSADGRVTGFIGVVPRRMLLDGRPIRLAVCSAYMAEPGTRPGGFALIKQFLRGPQDVSMPDGATEPARRVVEALGFKTYPSRSVNWFRMFRPTQAVLSRLERSATRSHRMLARAARPASVLFDRALARVPELGTEVELAADVRSRPLTTAELLGCIQAASRERRLRPDYDERSLQWVLDLRASATHRGRFVQRAVEDEDGKSLGWYLGHVQRGGVSEIVQIGALDGRMDLVMACALSDCARLGSAMVQGRLETDLLKPAIQNQCYFRPQAWACVHAHDATVHDAFGSEDVFLSPLESDWPW